MKDTNWTIQHAANAWKSGSHQIHFDDLGKEKILQQMFKLNWKHMPADLGSGVASHYFAVDGEWFNEHHMPVPNIPIIPISQINNDFKWGEEVEVSDDEKDWYSDYQFKANSPDGKFGCVTEMGIFEEWKYCRRPIKEQPIYTWATFEIKLEKLNKMYNHLRNTL